MVNAKKITANYSENFTRPTNADLLNVTSRTKSSHYWVLKSQQHQFLHLFICLCCFLIPQRYTSYRGYRRLAVLWWLLLTMNRGSCGSDSNDRSVTDELTRSFCQLKRGWNMVHITQSSMTHLTVWRRSSSKCYLRIQSVPQREHHTSPLQRSTG
jgi:hypothetical protein